MIKRALGGSDMPLLEQAALWFDRLQAGGLPEAERRTFEQWRQADPARAAAYAEVEQAHAFAKQAAETNEILALRHETLSRLVMPQATGGRRHAAAAAIAVALVALIGLVAWPHAERNLVPATPVAASPNAYETAIGERLSFTLADGSSVMLNTNSKLRIGYTAAERKLILDRGEALFQVAKGQKRPFIVIAGDQRITAHGTAFDVRIGGDDEVRVALIEGSVTVASTASKRAAPVAMQPQDVLVATSDTATVSRDSEIEKRVSWREGLVIFEDESLAEAVDEMNRYVRQPIVLRDPALHRIRLSGAFRTGETGAFIEALQLSFPIDVVERDRNRIVLASRG